MLHRIFLSLIAGSLLLATTSVYVQPVSAAEVEPPAPAPTSFKNPLGSEFTGEQGIRNAIIKLIKFMLSIAVILAIAALIFGGIMYITSLGNDQRVGLAKKIMLSAIIGLIIIILSQLIVQLVGKLLEVPSAPADGAQPPGGGNKPPIPLN